MLLSTVPAYLELAEVRDDAARECAWTDQYEASWPDIFTTYYSAWGDRGRRAEAAATAPDLAATILQREQRAVRLVTGAAGRLRQVGLLDEVELDVVLLVGGHTSNGWVTTFRGRPMLFLALEFLADPPYDEILVVHEALHLAHHRLRGTDWLDTIAGDVVAEGLAVALSRRLVAGHQDSAYLWFDASHDHWVGECIRQDADIRALAAAHWDTDDADPEVAALLHARPSGAVPARSGYWLGDQIVSGWLDSGREPPELMQLPYAATRRLLVNNPDTAQIRPAGDVQS